MLEIALYNPRQHRQFHNARGALLLARSAGEASVWTPVDESKARDAKVAVAVSCQADRVSLALTGCEAKGYGNGVDNIRSDCRLRVPAMFAIDDTRFEIMSAGQLASFDDRPLERLSQTMTGLREDTASEAGPSPATISRWFTAIGSVNRWANSLQELYAQAMRSAVEAIGLDGAMLLRRRDNCWEIAASHLPHPELGIHCNTRVLDELLAAPQTLFHGNLGNRADVESIEPTEAEFRIADFGLRIAERNPQSRVPSGCRNPQSYAAPAVVASPLRNAAGNLVGAVYGYRSVRAGNDRRGIRYLEAHMMELLAEAVSEGICRLEHEAEVDRRRVLMEQALAASHDESSRRMKSDEREVTLLFADLRRSTKLIAALEMDQAYELLGDVMDCLTTAVMDYDGLVIDYYGDGLAAMWNAPADQAEHAELACRAALRMLATLPEVAADWGAILSADLQLAIGLHTGKALVGNAGSRRRTKYGPRGPNVNLASRVEAAAKELQLPLVVTQATADRLSNRFTSHRICRARLRGAEQPVDLFAVSSAAPDEAELQAWAAYDTALRRFEEGAFLDAMIGLDSLDESIVTTPANFLAGEIGRAQGRQQRRRSTDGRGGFDGIMTLG
jgi:adenylate cyclase